MQPMKMLRWQCRTKNDTRLARLGMIPLGAVYPPRSGPIMASPGGPYTDFRV